MGVGLGGRTRPSEGDPRRITWRYRGTLLYELLGGLLFPLAETGKPFAATATTRLMTMLFFGFTLPWEPLYWRPRWAGVPPGRPLAGLARIVLSYLEDHR